MTNPETYDAPVAASGCGAADDCIGVRRLAFDRIELESSIPARFERVAAQFPHRLALQDIETRWTYRELDRRVNQVANAILDRVQPGSGCVAYLVDHSADMVICALAALKAGQAYVCLHPNVPTDAQRKTLDDTAPVLVLTHRAFEPRVHEIVAGRCGVLVLDDIDQQARAARPDVAIQAGDPAVIFYTSGSTGQAKGVVKSHRAVLHRAWLCEQYDHIGPTDRTSMFSYCNVSASESDLLGTLLNGAALCLFDLASRSMAELRAWIDEQQVTVLHPPVALLRRFLATLAGENLFPSVRLVVLAGEMVLPSDLESWRRLFSCSCALHIRFSSTEAGNLTVACIEPGDLLTPGLVPSGRPVADKHLSLLDERQREVPVGEVGELCVRSAYLSDGYWRKPEESACVFTAAPQNPQERIFRTGDRGRMKSDGSFEFIGRKDNQVKIRGYRVELKEVESALLALDAVQEAAVMVHRIDDETRLVAYVVNKPDRAFQLERVRAELRQVLPDWKIPARFVPLPAFPLTPSGKIDRQALPLPGDLRPELEIEYVAPCSLLEEQLARIWRELLGIERAGIHDNFFDLGGHSLLAARLVGKIEQSTGKHIPLATIFSRPTIAEMARFVESGQVCEYDLVEPIRTTGRKATVLYFGVDKQPTVKDFVPTDHPLYWCRLEHMEGKRLRYSTIEDLADHYCRELSKAGAKGPYVLCGYSFGGLVAVEVALQLFAREGADTLLFLVEPATPLGSAAGASLAGGNSPPQVASLWRQLHTLPASQKFSFAVRKARGFVRHAACWSKHGLSHVGVGSFDRWWKRCYCELRLLLKLDVPVGLRWFYAHKWYRQAIRNYVPRPIPGRLILVQRPDFDSGALLNQLTEGTPCLHKFDAPDHEAIVHDKRYVAQWKELLRASLRSLELTTRRTHPSMAIER